MSYEYVSNEEFEDIRNQIISEYNIKHGEQIPCKEILEMYDKFGGRLSIELFLEEVLGIRGTLIKDFKKGNVKNGKINFDVSPGEYSTFYKKKPKIPMHVLNPDYIYEIRKKLFSEVGMRVGDNISYSKIQELNNDYCPEMPEVIFAQKVIGMGSNSYNHLKQTKIENTTNELMFQDVDIPSEYIKALTDKIAILHKLEAGQLLEREEFQNFYDKYGGILSRKLFAILVLEMSHKSYNDTIERKLYKSASILATRKKTDFSVLSEKIVKAEGLHHGDKLEYQQFVRIHKLYAPNVSEFVFAEKVLGITNASLQNMKYNGGRSRIYLKLPTAEELKELQKKVILENGIHINDKLDYKEVERLHSIYGGIMPIKMFAVEVLGIDGQSFLKIKNDENNDESKKPRKAFALFNVVIPSSEMEKVRQKVMRDVILQNHNKLTLEEIKRLYDTYGGIMSLIMFAKEILGVSVTTLNDLKYERIETTNVCVRPDFNEEEVNTLKKYLIEKLSDDEIARKMGVTVTFLRRNMNNLMEAKELTEHNILYEKVKLLNNQGKSPEEIVEELEISGEDVKEMLHTYKKEKREERKREKEQKIQKKVENKEEKRKEEIERKARKAIDDYEYKEKSITNVRKYIKECDKSFKEGKFLKKDLDFLMECMIFVQCNSKEIELFSKICIFFNKYKMANDFILDNIDNEDVKPEEKVKLKSWRKDIDYAIKKEKALKLLKEGIKTPQEISNCTGVLEVDVLKLRRSLSEKDLSILGKKSSPGEDDSQLL